MKFCTIIIVNQSTWSLDNDLLVYIHCLAKEAIFNRWMILVARQTLLRDNSVELIINRADMCIVVN